MTCAPLFSHLGWVKMPYMMFLHHLESKLYRKVSNSLGPGFKFVPRWLRCHIQGDNIKLDKRKEKELKISYELMKLKKVR